MLSDQDARASSGPSSYRLVGSLVQASSSTCSRVLVHRPSRQRRQPWCRSRQMPRPYLDGCRAPDYFASRQQEVADGASAYTSPADHPSRQADPALLRATARPPNSFTASSASDFAYDSYLTSPASAFACPPDIRVSFTSASSSACRWCADVSRDRPSASDDVRRDHTERADQRLCSVSRGWGCQTPRTFTERLVVGCFRNQLFVSCR